MLEQISSTTEIKHELATFGSFVTDHLAGKPIDYRNFIGGRFADAATSFVTVTNPANGAVLGRVPDCGADVVEAAVQAALRAQGRWEKRSAIERAGYLRQISAKLRTHRLE